MEESEIIVEEVNTSGSTGDVILTSDPSTLSHFAPLSLFTGKLPYPRVIISPNT